MTALERHLHQLHERRTDRTLESYETIVECGHCHTTVALYEAAHGAHTEDEHRWGNHERFTCNSCLKEKTE